jgi:hypothetical protein
MGYFIILAIIFALLYYVSLRTHPYTKCRVCDGKSKHYNTIFPEAFRPCRKCGGSGRRERIGARLVRGDRS